MCEKKGLLYNIDQYLKLIVYEGSIKDWICYFSIGWKDLVEKTLVRILSIVHHSDFGLPSTSTLISSLFDT